MEGQTTMEMDSDTSSVTLTAGSILGNTELVFSNASDVLAQTDGAFSDGTAAAATYITTVPLHFLHNNAVNDTGPVSQNFLLKSVDGNTYFLDTSQIALLSGTSQLVLNNTDLTVTENGIIFPDVIYSKEKIKSEILSEFGINLESTDLNALEGSGDVLSIQVDQTPNLQVSGANNEHIAFSLANSIPSPQYTQIPVPQFKPRRGPGRPRREESDIDPPRGKGPYICEICGKEFPKWSQRNKHIKLHSEDKPYTCPLCPASYNVESNLTLHMVTHNKDDPTCPECNKKFARMASLKAHIMLHEKEESLFCPDCGDEFSTQSQLDAHGKEHQEDWTKVVKVKMYQCRLCHQCFSRATFLREHMKEHYKVKASLSHKSHKRNIDRSAFIHKCDTCSKCFQKPSQLVRHRRIHTGERPYKCEMCPRAFNQKGSLQIHMSKHNGIKPFSCEFCAAAFSQKGNLRAHILRVHTIPRSGEQVYKCTECTCVFKKLGSLNAHMSRMHYSQKGNGGTEEDTHLLDMNINSVLTDLADSQSDMEGDSRHLETQADSDILQQALVNSGLSGKEQSQNSELNKEDRARAFGSSITGRSGQGTREQRHRSSATSFVTLADKGLDGSVRRYSIRQRRVGNVRWHQCAWCIKEFKKPSDLVRHIRTHTHEKPYKCNHCFRSFAVKSTLTAHVRTHTGVKEYTCYDCNKKFSSASSLKVHKRMHTGNKPFPCQQCTKSFRTAGHRKAHILSHIRDSENVKRKNKSKIDLSTLPPITLQEPIIITENGLMQSQLPPNSQVFLPGDAVSSERPHKCAICCAAFRKSSHLKLHVRIHTGERPFKCDQCHKSFVSNGILKAHLRTHEGLKVHKCGVCNNSFSTNGSLKRHVATHNEARPYMCPYCHKTFKTSLNCRKHMKTHCQELALQAARQEKGSKDSHVTPAVEVNGTAFTSDRLSADYSQDFPEHTFTMGTTEQQDQNALVQTLTAGDLTESTTLPSTQGVIAHTLHADATGTITLPSLSGQHTLTQENISEIERTLSEQIFGSSTTSLVNRSGDAGTLTVTTTEVVSHSDSGGLVGVPGEGDGTGTVDEEEIPDDASDVGSATTEELAQSLAAVAASSPPPAQQPLIEEPLIRVLCHPRTNKANVKSDPSGIFDAAFGPQSFDNCVFSSIALQGDPLALETLTSGTAITTILPESTAESAGAELTTDLGDDMPVTAQLALAAENLMRNGEEQVIAEVEEEEEEAIEVDGDENEQYGNGEIQEDDDEREEQNEQELDEDPDVEVINDEIQEVRRHKPFTCSLCDNQFRTEAQLRRHIKFHEPREKKGQVIARSIGEPRAGRRRPAVIQLSPEETQVLAQQSIEDAASMSEKVLISSAAEKDRISELRDPDDQYRDEPLFANQCKYCPKSFRKPSDLVRHVRIHTGERPYQCNFCTKCFTVKSTLDSHMKTHSGQKLCTCHVCERSFATKGSLKVHMRLHTGAKPFKCPYCDMRFRTSGHRKAHLMSHIKEGQSGKASAPQGTKSHKKRKLASAEDSSKTKSNHAASETMTQITLDASALGNLLPLATTDSLNPATLLTGGTDGTSLVNNLQLQLSDGFQITGIDGALLATQSLQIDESIIQHLQQASNIIIQTSIPNVEEASAVENPSMDQHEQDDMEEEVRLRYEVQTDESGQIINIHPATGDMGANVIFNVGADLGMQVIGEADTALSLTDQPLPFRFRVTDSLKGGRSLVAVSEPEDKKEIITDTIEVDDDFLVFHDCETCGKRFSKPSQLERHNRIHTGERPFACHLCTKRFNQKNALITHLKSHTGERPYACPHCDYSFTQKGNLKTHLKRAHRFSSLGLTKSPVSPSKSILKIKQPTLAVRSPEMGNSLEQVVCELFPHMGSTSLSNTENTSKLC